MNVLQIIEHQNQRVLLTSQLAESYETNSKTISYNFNHNKNRYKEGKHYFLLEGDELKTFREFHDMPNNLNRIYLWTERGALLHAKSLNTDKAWEVYDLLVEHYFRSKSSKALPTNYKEALIQLVEQVEENEQLRPKALFADAVSASPDSIYIGDLAKLLKQNGINIGQNRLFLILRNEGYLIKRESMRNEPTQRSLELGIMELVENVWECSGGLKRINKQTFITGKGQIYFINKFLKKKDSSSQLSLWDF